LGNGTRAFVRKQRQLRGGFHPKKIRNGMRGIPTKLPGTNRREGGMDEN